MNDSLRHVTTAIATLLFATILHANPKGGQVTVGNVTITEGPGAMTITQGDRRAIIHWQDFSIGAGEITQFIHPDSKSATLNRVVGGIPSSILGTLKANGQVFLINPNGILVGPTGVINTAGFVASTLDVPDAQFMAGGDMNFSGASMAGVVNLGSITATDGDVILMARTVENAGTINAPNGVAALAAGNDILLQAVGDERVVVKSGIAGGGTGVSNSGTINAAQAELKAAGGNVYALAVNNTGVVKATGIAQKNGRVILSSEGGVVQNSGQLVAKNADGSGGTVKMNGGKGGAVINNGLLDAAATNNTKPGGTVEILGDAITIGSSSVINASGSDGGVISIGVAADAAAQTTETGGIATLAADPKAKAAQTVMIQANSVILANASNVGKGGKIVVWSDEGSVVGGVIEAKGGENGGDGGLIETSAKKGLIITSDAQVRASAPHGKAGTWLLDPIYNFSIVAGAGLTNNGGATAFTATGNNSSVGADLISAQLDGGTNVTIATTSAVGAGVQTGNIFVNSAITKSVGTAATLQMTADGSITVNADIDGGTAGNLSVNLDAELDITSVAGAKITATDLTMTSNNGSVILSGPVVVDTLQATLTNFFSGGVVQINHPTQNQIGTINGITSSHGVLVRDSAGGLVINGNISGGGFAFLDNFPVILRTVGDFTINPGASIFTNSQADIFIEAKDGYFINRSGSPFNQGLGSSSGWSIYSASNATVAFGGLFDDGGLIAAQGPTGDFTGQTFPAVLSNVTAKTFFFINAPGVPIGGGGGGGGGGGFGGGGGGGVTSAPLVSSRLSAAREIAGLNPLGGFVNVKLPDPQDFNQNFNAESLKRGTGFSAFKATLIMEPILDPRNDEEIMMEKRGDWILNQKDATGLREWITEVNHTKNADLDYEYRTTIGGYQSNIAWLWAQKAEAEGRPWQIFDSYKVGDPKEGTPVAFAGTQWGSELKVTFADASSVVVPPGGKVVYAGQGYYNVVDAQGKFVKSGQRPLMLSTGVGNEATPALTQVAAGNQAQAHIEAKIGPSMRLSNGQQIVVANNLPPITDVGTLIQLRSQWPQLGRKIGETEITAMANIVAAGGGNMTRQDIASIVAAGGGNLTPGIIAAIVAGGGGNLSGQSIAQIVAAGGGNIVAGGGGNIVAGGGGNIKPMVMMQILTAGIVAGGGGNIVAAGGGNIVAGGGGNIVAGGGGNIVAGGGLNFTAEMAASIVSAGGLNMAPSQLASMIEHDTTMIAKLVGNDGGSLIGHDGSTLLGNDGASGLQLNGTSFLGNDGASGLQLNGTSFLGNDGASGLQLNGIGFTPAAMNFKP